MELWSIGGIVAMQEMQQMFAISPVPILTAGFMIAILLIVIGFREKSDYSRKTRLMRAGGILLGLMIIATGLTWYGYLASTSSTPLALEDVVILTLVSSIGGLISGISSYIPISQYN